MEDDDALELALLEEAAVEAVEAVEPDDPDELAELDPPDDPEQAVSATSAANAHTAASGNMTFLANVSMFSLLYVRNIMDPL